jgi:hypothetical protein
MSDIFSDNVATTPNTATNAKPKPKGIKNITHMKEHEIIALCILLVVVASTAVVVVALLGIFDSTPPGLQYSPVSIVSPTPIL